MSAKKHWHNSAMWWPRLRAGSPHVRSSQNLWAVESVRAPVLHRGYRSQNMMAAMASGAQLANASWQICSHNYDVEVFGFLSYGIFSCGIWLGGEWQLTNEGNVKNAQDRHFNVVPYGDRRPYLPQSMPQLLSFWAAPGDCSSDIKPKVSAVCPSAITWASGASPSFDRLVC